MRIWTKKAVCKFTIRPKPRIIEDLEYKALDKLNRNKCLSKLFDAFANRD